MAAQTYGSIQEAILAALAQAPPPYNLIPIDFQTLFPQAISYAENRIFREIPMIAEREQVNTPPMSAGENIVFSPVGAQSGIGPVFIERFGIIKGGQTYWYDKASADFVGLIWTNPSETVDPDLAEWLGRYWAPNADAFGDDATFSQTAIIFAPPVTTGGLVATVVGLFPPTPLSVANQQTYLSTLYPDLLEAAIMVFMNRYLLKNAGASADTPEMTLTFEDDCMRLMEAAKAEELRRRGIAPPIGLPAQPHAAAPER